MKQLYFVSSNKHKVEEIKTIAKEFNLKIKAKKMKLAEAGNSLGETAKFKADYAWKKIRKPLFVEDTGVFFREYNNFPGHTPKRVFLSLGFKGLLALVKRADNKKAFFQTTVCCKLSKNHSKTFSGVLNGRLSTKIIGADKNVLPYEKLFIPKGHKKALSLISREEKNGFSHRAVAVRKFFEWISKK